MNDAKQENAAPKPPVASGPLPARDSMDKLLSMGAWMTDARNAPADCEPFVLVPKDSQLQPLAALCPPTRIKARATFKDGASFVAYVNRFKDGDTLIFANISQQGGGFTAYLDYHEAEFIGSNETGPSKPKRARRAEHVAVYECTPTVEWKTWMGQNQVRMSQPDFALWLEENQRLLVTPNGADLLEFISNLEGHNEVRFTSAVKLQNGKNALCYEEDVALQGKTNQGTLEVPQIIEAGIAPFEGLPPIKVQARLKYRIESRRLQFWFDTITPHLIIKTAVAGVLEQITEGTKITPLMGTVQP